MELDELKNLWKKQGDAFQQRDPEEIAKMLKGNSTSIISKIKRSVWFELAVTLAAGVALLVYALTLDASTLRNMAITILVIFVGYTVYYIKKLNLLNKFDVAGKDIRSNLEVLIDNLSSYLKYYRLSYTILYPVYFVVGIIMGGVSQGADYFFDVLSQTRSLVILGGLGVVFYICSTWLVNWLLKKLYGNHLQKLKQLLNDIREEPKIV